MIIECPKCNAKYQYSESRFEGKASKKIRCAKCQEIFEIRNPDNAAEGQAEPASPPPRPLSDETFVRGRAAEESTLSAALPGRSTDRLDANLKMPEGIRLSLAIIDGPDTGKVYRIEKPKVVIGRSNADFVLNDIESSRNHAMVEVRDSQVLLQDLESTNGTLHDGEKIQGTVSLQNHSEFQVGTTTLMLIITEAE